ncbi:MAG: hypothetical protein CMP12_04410 [Zunongwangia sp.]|nr:hypothetical protein [Zunongwangia profunda]MAO35147.1 hypothetical protein [Zunongwangia sp.]HCV80715.1 hypothetical protein [Zunongwangia profunda]|tara:strand:+ start:255 stop:473 length:219 start_codon:yes stop_codon:yes gene_type:complete
MLKNYVSLMLLLLLIQSCTPDNMIEEVEMNNQNKVNLEDLNLREFADTENDTISSTPEDSEGGEELPDDGRD